MNTLSLNHLSRQHSAFHMTLLHIVLSWRLSNSAAASKGEVSTRLMDTRCCLRLSAILLSEEKASCLFKMEWKKSEFILRISTEQTIATYERHIVDYVATFNFLYHKPIPIPTEHEFRPLNLRQDALHAVQVCKRRLHPLRCASPSRRSSTTVENRNRLEVHQSGLVQNYAASVEETGCRHNY